MSLEQQIDTGVFFRKRLASSAPVQTWTYIPRFCKTSAARMRTPGFVLTRRMVLPMPGNVAGSSKIGRLSSTKSAPLCPGPEVERESRAVRYW
jgi:hypothetical protein